MKYVLCWDIDGTLLTTARAGISAWEDAVHATLGVPCDLSDFPTASLTDIEIARRLVEVYGTGGEPSVDGKVLRAYERGLPSSLPKRDGHVLPGVREALDYFASGSDVGSILLTGNTQTGADTKLTYFGLKDYFNRGAFADGTDNRVSIARKALSIAYELLAGEPSPERVYVIGDTPRDIDCGKAIGARTVAVATGSYGYKELQEEEPWLALPGLPSPEEFSRALDIPEPSPSIVAKIRPESP